jgi:hypothetical protein
VIGDRDRRHLKFSRLFHQLFHPDSAIQQRVFSMQMQVNERVASHQFSVLNVKNISQIKAVIPSESRGIPERNQKLILRDLSTLRSLS